MKCQNAAETGNIEAQLQLYYWFYVKRVESFLLPEGDRSKTAEGLLRIMV